MTKSIMQQLDWHTAYGKETCRNRTKIGCRIMPILYNKTWLLDSCREFTTLLLRRTDNIEIDLNFFEIESAEWRRESSCDSCL